MRRAGTQRDQTLAFPAPEKLGEGLIAVGEGEPLRIQLRLESMHEGILATGSVATTATGVCGRCLREITQGVQVDFGELFAYPSGEAFDYEVHDDHVDLEPLVRDAVVLSLPFQPVCRPDCPGLDQVTGERLARESDGKPRETIDPRWSALAGFHASADEPGAPAGDEH